MTVRSNSTTRLEKPLAVRCGLLAADIRTISDAALFITRLPKRYDGELHWTLAGSTLEAADRHPTDAGLLKTASRAMENALKTEQMLADC
jgi:hypothetical protein